MATTVRNIDGLLARHAAKALNNLRVDLVRMRAGVVYHADASAADASPTAADLPTVLVMANALKAEFNTHLASVLITLTTSATYGQGAHFVADAVNPVVAAAATDQGTANTLLTAIKAAFNAHLTQATIHVTNDAVNAVAAADATTLGSSITLANACKTAMNAHFAAALNHPATVIVPA